MAKVAMNYTHEVEDLMDAYQAAEGAGHTKTAAALAQRLSTALGDRAAAAKIGEDWPTYHDSTGAATMLAKGDPTGALRLLRHEAGTPAVPTERAQLTDVNPQHR